MVGPQDLPHTYANHAWLVTPDGQASLRRVLSAYSVHNESVGYCRSMNNIAALLLVALNRRWAGSPHTHAVAPAARPAVPPQTRRRPRPRTQPCPHKHAVAPTARPAVPPTTTPPPSPPSSPAAAR